ncbi:MAG: hypothetical protein ACOC6G_03080 [Thermoproteota archaeon]
MKSNFVALFSLIGIFAISLKEETLHNILFVLVAFSAGSILGAVNFYLLPEAIELVEGPSGPDNNSLFLLLPQYRSTN